MAHRSVHALVAPCDQFEREGEVEDPWHDLSIRAHSGRKKSLTRDVLVWNPYRSAGGLM